MLRRTYRRMPQGFADFERQFGFRIQDARKLVGVRKRWKVSVSSSRKEILYLARMYLKTFAREPHKTHVFPMRGAVFQFEFAKGVRDAAGLETRLRTITPLKTGRHADWYSLKQQAEKLRLRETGIVMHDYVFEEKTKRAIAEAVGIPKEEIKVHQLAESQVKSFFFLPVFRKGKKKVHQWKVAGKQFVKEGEEELMKMIEKGRQVASVELKRTNLSARERAFIKRAAYAAGVAAARELLRQNPKVLEELRQQKPEGKG